MVLNIGRGLPMVLNRVTMVPEAEALNSFEKNCFCNFNNFKIKKKTGNKNLKSSH